MAEKFTEAQVDRIVGEYMAVIDEDYTSRTAVVAALAEEFGVSENSIRGKLVAEEIYKRKEVEKKTSTKRVDKEAIVKAFEASFGIKLKSMTNMTGKDLQAFWDRFVEMSAMRDADEGK
jgi:hypothetical protein